VAIYSCDGDDVVVTCLWWCYNCYYVVVSDLGVIDVGGGGDFVDVNGNGGGGDGVVYRGVWCCCWWCIGLVLVVMMSLLSVVWCSFIFIGGVSETLFVRFFKSFELCLHFCGLSCKFCSFI